MTGNGSSITELLDLYCGVGGAAEGYKRAGFKVVGVDINPQPEYAGDEFIQADAIEYLMDCGSRFPVKHASPPCHYSSTLTKGTNKGREYINLIPKTRAALMTFDTPWVIENVMGAKMDADMVLCGEMFGLDVIRHRKFEFGPGCRFYVPKHIEHREGGIAGWNHGEWSDGPYYQVYGEGGGKGSVEEWQDAMGIHWTASRKSIAQAIPPAYAEYVGAQLKRSLEFW